METLPLRRAFVASSGLSMLAVISGDLVSAFESSITLALCGSPSIATNVFSGAEFLKAIPRAKVINTGKTKTQNTASFSRRNSRQRILVSSMSGCSDLSMNVLPETYPQITQITQIFLKGMGGLYPQ